MGIEESAQRKSRFWWNSGYIKKIEIGIVAGLAAYFLYCVFLLFIININLHTEMPFWILKLIPF